MLEPGVADQVSAILQTVVKNGTATRAQIPGVMVAGKTGTTENYGDAWFVGWTKEYTVAVWVGYPDEFKPMETEFQGEPVAGGTYPAGDLEDASCMALLKIDPLPKKDGGDGTGQAPTADSGRRHLAAADARRPPRRPRRRRRRRRRRDRRRRASSRRRRRRRQPPAEQDPPAADPPPTNPPATDPGRRAGAAADDRRAARAAPAGGTGTRLAASREARRPRARDVARAERAEAPRQLGGLRDPDPRARSRTAAARRARIRIGPSTSDVSFSLSSMPSAWVSLPGPLAQLARAAARAHLREPSSGSSARISTAAPTPSGSQTAFSSAWMP